MNRPRRVALVNANLIQQPAVAPLSLDILATSLCQEGYEISILDLTPVAQTWEHFIDEFLAKSTPDYIGISFRNSWDLYLPSIDSLSEQGSFIPSHKRVVDKIAEYFPRKKIIAGGVGFSFMPEVMLKRLDLNYGIIGAGEMVLPELLRRLDRRQSFEDLPYVLQKDKEYKKGKVPAFLSTINRKDFVNNKWYYEYGEHVGIRTNNGCVKSCVFCPEKTVKGGLFRQNLENVLMEIDQLIELGVKDIHLNDSEMNMPFQFSKQFAKYIINRKYPSELRFWSYMQPTPFDEEYAKLWRKAGMRGIDFGTDHTNPEMLKRLGKWYKPEDIARTTRICQENGIAVMHELLFGMYGETPDTIKRSIDFIWSLNPHVIGTTLGIGVTPKSLLASNPIVREAIKEKYRDVRREKYGLYCRGVPLEDPTYVIDPVIKLPEVYFQIKEHVGERVSRIMIPTLDSVSASNNQLVNSERIINMKKREQKGAHWYYYPTQF